MGTWGIAVSSDDTYQDIKQEFFELYNEGFEPLEIASRLIESNKDLVGVEEDGQPFWFALAQCLWDCKALDVSTLTIVTDIIKSGANLRLWKEAGASTTDLRKRECALKDFLAKLNTEKPKPKKRKKKILVDSVFEKGDCLVFQTTTGVYSGALVLESERGTEFGLNLIMLTDIAQSTQPTIRDFRNARILVTKRENGPSKFIDYEEILWFYAKFYKKSSVEFQKIGSLAVKDTYSVRNDYGTLCTEWDTIPASLDTTARIAELHGAPQEGRRVKRLLKRRWF